MGLETIKDANYLVHVAANGEVVGAREADDALGVDDDGGAEGDAGFRMQDAEVVRQLGRVKEKRVVDAAEVAVVVAPREVELVVGRTAEHDGIAIREGLELLVELDNLGRAHESEVLRVRVEDEPLSSEVRGADILELFPFSVPTHAVVLNSGRRIPGVIMFFLVPSSSLFLCGKLGTLVGPDGALFGLAGRPCIHGCRSHRAARRRPSPRPTKCLQSGP